MWEAGTQRKDGASMVCEKEAREGLTTRFCGLPKGLGDGSWPRGCLWNAIARDVHEMLLSQSSDSVPPDQDPNKAGGVAASEGRRTITARGVFAAGSTKAQQGSREGGMR